MRQSTAQVTDQRAGEGEDAFGHTARTHQFSGQKKQHDRDQREAVDTLREKLRNDLQRQVRPRDHQGDDGGGEQGENERDSGNRQPEHQTYEKEEAHTLVRGSEGRSTKSSATLVRIQKTLPTITAQ